MYNFTITAEPDRKSDFKQHSPFEVRYGDLNLLNNSSLLP